MIVIVAALQSAATFFCLLATFSVDLDHPAAESGLRGVLLVALEILSFPLLTLISAMPGTGRWFPGLSGYLPFVLNGLVWATTASFAVDRWYGRHDRNDPLR
jgi:hypothetical protein